MKQNLHTHTCFCDGKNWVSEIICSALEKGFDVLGFSGHSFTYFDKSYCMLEDGTKEYISSVRAAKNFFLKDQDLAKSFYGWNLKDTKDLRIYLGIEQDIYTEEPALRKEQGIFNFGYPGGIFDYVIGSVHAYRLTWGELEERRGTLKGLAEPRQGAEFSDDGAYIYVDYSPEVFSWAGDSIYKGDMMAMARDYFADESRIVRDTDCDIVGHFDLLLKFNEEGKFFDEESSLYRSLRDHALEEIFRDFREKNRMPVFEINTGAMARGYRSVPYPSLETLKVINEMGGQIVINSDCHDRNLLDYGFEEAAVHAKKAGFREALYIGKDERAELMSI